MADNKHLNDNSFGQSQDEDDCVDLSSESGAASTSTDVDGITQQENIKANRDNALAKAESKNVKRLRWVMILILFMVTVVAVVGVYFFSRGGETREFEQEFAGQAFKVISGFKEDSIRKLQALDTLAGRITAYALDSESPWPFVTIPNSVQLFEPFLGLANAAAIFMIPIVGARQRADWEGYALEKQVWVEEDLLARSAGANFTASHPDESVSSYIKNYVGVDTSPEPYLAQWHYAPVIPNRYFINFNRLALDGFTGEYDAIKKGRAVLSQTWTYEPGLDFQSTRDFNFMNEVLMAGGNGEYTQGEPVGYISSPIFESFDEDNQKIVGVLTATVYWRSYFENLLPGTVEGIVCVVENSIGQKFSYRIDGQNAKFLGLDDLHETKFDRYMVSAKYSVKQDELDTGSDRYKGVPLDDDHISYWIRVYPSSTLEAEYLSNRPAIYAAAVFLIFFLTSIMFLTYDWVVERRQNIVSKKANQAQAVVSSLFPEEVGKRLMQEAAHKQEAQKNRLSAFLNDGEENKDKNSDPIADFFPETTIMFSDIKGFTSWSSVREPVQVFKLLESIFGAFDEIATRRRVFKVETIGDCYVAVCGLPDPCKDHAVIMGRFAHDCGRKVRLVLSELETELGPGTSELDMRFGLHSGPVTAGCMRGAKARFQLFGDTMNTASRMESTSIKGRIQVSEQTAGLLEIAGKGAWLQSREDMVEVKGKGYMRTYWLEIGRGKSVGSVTDGTSVSDPEIDNMGEVVTVMKKEQKSESLIGWNYEILKKYLKLIAARNKTLNTPRIPVSRETETSSCKSFTLDEVKEIIEMPKFEVNGKAVECDNIELSHAVETQLNEFVHQVEKLYHATNPFHNFEHATHVAMSVVKLLSRIVSPSDKSFGISDPLTQFTCVFVALIHDLFHPGIPNFVIVKEFADVSAKYRNRSVAEQQSIDLSWALLMDDGFADLRAAIYSNPTDFKRFRALVVNGVVATDIFDPKLKEFREARWEKAFSPSVQGKVESSTDIADRKATIVIEHLIQASDVSHTMQHFLVYQKWNKKLFHEMMLSYKGGKIDKNPADDWYQGEIKFFDGYIIPLARKLGECHAFGVSSDEYLRNATQNRNEWVRMGAGIVNEMLEEYMIMENTSNIIDSPEATKDEEKRTKIVTTTGNLISL